MKLIFQHTQLFLHNLLLYLVNLLAIEYKTLFRNIFSFCHQKSSTYTYIHLNCKILIKILFDKDT